MRSPASLAALSLALGACAAPPSRALPDAGRSEVTPWWSPGPAPHHGTLVYDPARELLAVALPDSDAVALVSTSRRALVGEVALGPAPAPDARGRWAPSVGPRAVALSPSRGWAYAACERSGEVVSLDLSTGAVTRRATVCPRAVSVLVSGDETAVFVSCAADGAVLSLDAGSLSVRLRAAVGGSPRALALSNEGETLYVTQHGEGRVSALDAATLAPRGEHLLPDLPPRGHRALAHGAARALADAATRPGSRELWVPHQRYATETSQPALNFESTVFPAISVVVEPRPTRTSDATLDGRDGAFDSVVSGPQSVAFVPGGRYALLLGRNSENVLVLDADTGQERASLGALPGALPDGLVVAPDGRRAWLHERNTGDVVALSLGPDATPTVEGPPIPARARDPMPARLRRGQFVFHTSNDRFGRYPITTNRWLACESCHVEGGTAGVTQRFLVGPRDIPSLHGGLDGFLQRTATRASAGELWRTINAEQGGQFRPDDDYLAPDLDALSAYVTLALPALPSPTLPRDLVARGRAVFHRDDVGCAGCHSGPRYTDSGEGNPTLSLSGPVRLHDVGTCVTEGPSRDQPHADLEGHPRDGCSFDTPTLVGVNATAPYLHDGSAATLLDLLTTRNRDERHGHTRHLAREELLALEGFLRSL